MRSRSPLATFGFVVFACAGALVAGRSLGLRLAGPGPGAGADGAIVVARDRDPGDEEDPHDLDLAQDAADAAGRASGRGSAAGEGGDAGEGGAGRGGADGRTGGPGAAGGAETAGEGLAGAKRAASSARSKASGPRTATPTAAPPASAEPPAPEPDATVTGRVTDVEGRPLPDAHVKLVSGRKTYQEVATGADGRYTTGPVVAGRYRAIARAAGYIDRELPGPLDVAAASVTTADFELRPSGAIAGIVLDPEGEAVAGARVAAERGAAFGGLDTTTGADGRFVLRGMGAGRVRFRATHASFLPSKWVDVDVPKLEDGSGGAVDGVTLALQGGAAIEGATFAADGTPVAVAVSLYDARGRRVRRTSSAVEGGYRFEGLGGGQFQVATDPLGGAVAREDVQLPSGERRRLDLVLTGGGSIAGRCIDEKGEPVAGARLTAAAQGIGFAPGASSKADGTFAIDGLFDAQYIVSARPPEAYTAPEPIPVVVAGANGPRDLVFELRAGATISGRIAASDGGAAGGARVSIYDEAGTLLAAADADPAGRYRLTRIPAGNATLYASAAGELGRTTLTLAAGEDRALDLELAPPARIKGTVRLATGDPANGATAEARSPDGAVRRTSRTNRDGAFDLRDLYPGRYSIRATHGQGVSETLEFEVGARQVLEGIVLTIR